MLVADLQRMGVKLEEYLPPNPIPGISLFSSINAALKNVHPVPDRIIINSLVSFAGSERLMSQITDYVNQSGSPLTILLHDFHSVCPSYTLMDFAGRYCGVPAVEACRLCFSKLDFPFVNFSVSNSVEVWRESWRSLFNVADEIVVFSESSKEIFARAYSEFLPQVTVRPHVTRSSLRPVSLAPVGPILVVGIIGHITVQKGSLILSEMARRCDEGSLPIRFLVFGTIEGRQNYHSLSVLGRYAPARLPDLLEKNAVNVCAFLSIIPETFSFVCSELISMRVPLIAFDLGAQGERLREYENSYLIKSISAEAVLDALLGYRNKQLKNSSK